MEFLSQSFLNCKPDIPTLGKMYENSLPYTYNGRQQMYSLYGKKQNQQELEIDLFSILS